MLASVSGGKVYFVPDGTGVEDIDDALSGSLTYQPEVPTEDKVIVVAKESFGGTESFTGNFYIDSSLGKEVFMTVDYGDGGAVNTVSVYIDDDVYFDNAFDGKTIPNAYGVDIGTLPVSASQTMECQMTQCISERQIRLSSGTL